MKRRINSYLLILPLLTLLVSCSRDVFDEYYARPDYLENPIYQRLDELGNFKNFTVLIEKAGYKDILSKSGYWTMFAPNDAAFAAYFQEKGISDVSKIDAETATKIVRYALVYNAFREEQLSDYQSRTGWIKDAAFRRRTALYDGFLTKTIDGQPMVIVGSNRNGSVNYIDGDNNNKYITYFTDEYFQENGLNASDFNFFYPNKQYSGFNVFDSKVAKADIIAENGVIHEIDKVNLPLENIDQYLERNTNYSLFRDIIERNLVSYVFNQNATNAYFNFTGNSDQVFVKRYDPTLAFALNNENYLKVDDNDGQAEAYTLFVPNNEKFQAFIDDILLKHFDSLNQLPIYVFQDLINAHMSQAAVWPSVKGRYSNALKEDLRFDFDTEIIDKQILSNGFFYGTNTIQKSNLFYSVYTSAYLDPAYTFVTRIFNDGTGYKEMISNVDQNFTIFLPSDEVLKRLGFSYNIVRSEWAYVNPVNQISDNAAASRNRLIRLLYNCIVFTPNGELDEDKIASTSGIIRTGDSDLPGEYIKWGGAGTQGKGRIYAAGNEIGTGSRTYANIIGMDKQENGIAYYVDNLPFYSTEYQGLVIKRLATANPAKYSEFFKYLSASSIYTSTGGEEGKIDGVALGTPYTFIIPDNAAMGRAGLPAFNTTLQGERDQIADFIRYHIIVNKTASNDGHVNGQFETLRKDGKGEKTYIEVISTGTPDAPGTLSFRDNSGNNPVANVITIDNNNNKVSNELADRSLIHSTDNYLKFTEEP